MYLFNDTEVRVNFHHSLYKFHISDNIKYSMETDIHVTFKDLLSFTYTCRGSF